MIAPLLGMTACLQMVMAVCCAGPMNCAPVRGHDGHRHQRQQPAAPDQPMGCHATLGCAAHRRGEGDEA